MLRRARTRGRPGSGTAKRVDFAVVADSEEQRKPLYSRPVMRRRGVPFQARIVLLALAGGLPAILLAIFLLSHAPIADSVYRLAVVLLLAAWVGFAVAVHQTTVEPLRSIANLLEALRGGDYAIRGRHGRKGDALGDIVLEANRLGATLRTQRFEALEASALLNKVLAEIDVAVFAFDGDERIRLVNRAAGELLRRHPDSLVGLSAAEIGFHELLEGPPVSSESHTFPGRAGRWQVMREGFHEAGRSFRLADFRPLPELGELQRSVYLVPGSKVITEEYLKQLSPLALAIWFMDDGSFTLRSKGLQSRTLGGSGGCSSASKP